MCEDTKTPDIVQVYNPKGSYVLINRGEGLIIGHSGLPWPECFPLVGPTPAQYADRSWRELKKLREEEINE